MLGQFTGKHEANSSLDLAAAEGGLLVVSGELSSFSGDALENVVDERVHDGHSFLGDTSVRVDLLQHTVDVGRVRFHAFLGSGGGGGLFGRFCRFLGGCLGHGCKNKRMDLIVRVIDVSKSSLTPGSVGYVEFYCTLNLI